ncbi:MAG TPA: co-chaperone GroES family protein [Candidatus Krumholzibacteria bacterium]|nr:co-chaperone GroES family protein [Candidatus Krumholzibacteria bacterium]HPD70545.1 co-chaperone GroES family protein [Candidatus Krumholzibacteria bacterium]HRY39755.1 co-chaperone GroES family protein [Candidatus Krumholzibacteria bacterium]
MADLKKRLIVVGDRILVRPENGEERTGAGLYLPQTALSARQAQGGWVVSVGPGVPIPEPADVDEDPDDHTPPRYLPMQAQEGDYALFLKKAAIEITFEKKQYLIVPNAAILVLIREEWDPASESESWDDGAAH